MKLTLRKTLLAGTAIIAVGAFVAPSAQAADLSAAASATWAGAAGQTSADVANASAGDNLDITGDAVDITVTNDATADDGGGVNAFTIGTITDSSSAEDGDLIIVTGAAADMTVAITAATLDGNVDIQNSANDGDITTTLTGALTAGGTLVVDNSDNTTEDALALNVGGALSVTGTTTLTAGAFAGAATSDISVDGNATFTGAVTVTGGANAAADATLTLSGATNTFTGGLALTDGTNGSASMVLDGTVAQTVAGAITGDGDITVTNTHASGVTFTGANTNSGTITVNNDGNDQAVKFTGDVSSAITLGDNSGTDTVTATFGTSSATDVSGVVSGGGAADTVALVFTGGDTVTLSGAATSNIDTVTVSGSTTLDSNAAITATTITVASGSTLDQGIGTITGAIDNSGTIHQTGTGDITGDITGTGTLNIDESATYTGNVAGSSADIATGKTLTFAGANEYSVTTTSLTGTGALELGGANQTISGDITAAADGDGSITISDDTSTTAFTGNIGTSSASVATLAVAGGANNTVTTTGNLYIDAITLDDADTLQFLGTSAQAVSGTIDGVGATDGAIIVGDGTTTSDVTFSGVIGGTTIGALTVSDNAKATFNDDATFSGAVSADGGEITIAAGKTLSAATQTDADVTTWNIGVDKVGGGAQTNATVAFSGDAVNLAVDTVNFVITEDSAPLTTGASVLDNVFTGNAANTIAGATVTDNSFIYGFELVDDTNNVDVTVSVENSIDSLASTAGNKNVGNMLLTTLVDSTDTQINKLQGNLAAASTQAAANEVLEASIASVDGGAVVAAMGVTNQTVSITNTRLAALRNGDAVMTGMSAGNASTGMQIWGQVFGTAADQDERDGVNGYDADTLGVAVGMETETIADNAVVGVAFAYANTDVESDSISSGYKTETDVDSYQITLYGDYDLDERTYLSGQIGYSFNNNDTTRSNVGGVSGLTAKGDYDSNQLSARIEAGRSYEVSNGFVLTPSVSANYMNYDADSYTETGAGGASLTVDSDSLNVLEFGLGVEAAWTNENSDGSVLKPTLHVGVRHDVIGDQFEANNTFTGGGVAFKTEGFDPAQTTFNGGVGVTYFSTENWNLTADYDAELKSDYLSHSGLLKAAYKF